MTGGGLKSDKSSPGVRFEGTLPAARFGRPERTKKGWSVKSSKKEKGKKRETETAKEKNKKKRKGRKGAQPT